MSAIYTRQKGSAQFALGTIGFATGNAILANILRQSLISYQELLYWVSIVMIVVTYFRMKKYGADPL